MKPRARLAAIYAAVLFSSCILAWPNGAEAQGFVVVEEAVEALTAVSRVVGLESVEARTLGAFSVESIGAISARSTLTAESISAFSAQMGAGSILASAVTKWPSDTLQSTMDQRWRAIMHLGPDYELAYYRQFARALEDDQYFNALDKLHHAEYDALLNGGVDWKYTNKATQLKKLTASIALQVSEGKRLSKWAEERGTLSIYEQATFNRNLARLQAEVASAERMFRPTDIELARRSVRKSTAYNLAVLLLDSSPPILHGYRLPSRCSLYTVVVGSDGPVYIVGTRMDLEHVLDHAAAFGLTISNTPSAAKNRAGQGAGILKSLQQMPAQLYANLYGRVEPGHVLVLMSRDGGLVNIAQHVREVRRKDDADRDGREKRTGNKDKTEEKRCEHVGKICFDTKGHVSVGLGCEGGVEVEASTDGEFEVSMPVGSAKIALTGK